MEPRLSTRAIDEPAPAERIDPAGVLSVLRSAVGVGTWISPAVSGRVFALGPIGDDPRTALIARLFGVRELVLAQAVRHPSPEVRRTALQVGVAVDAVDLVASLVALRKGASKATLLTVTAGAALFIGLGVAALAREDATPGE